MLKLYFSILLVYFGILNDFVEACPNFKYEQRNNRWVGVVYIPLSLDSTTIFETVWFLANLEDKPELSDQEQESYVRIDNLNPAEVIFTFPNQNSLPTLTKLTISDKLVCSGQEPKSYVAKVTLSGETSAQRSQANSQPAENPFLQPATTNQGPTPKPTPITTSTRRPAAAPVVDRQITTATTQEAVNGVCGRRTTLFTPFIVGGRQAILGQIPWLVAIMAKVRGGVFFVCGGSLISARTVISAAHCFDSRLTKNDVVLYLGKHQLDNYNERFETREPNNILIHTDYSQHTPPDADLAIIQFELPVGFTDTISPICLWTGPEDVHEIAGQRGFVAGWGSDGLRNNVTNIPKMVDTAIVSDNVCRTDRHIPAQFVTSRVLCAGNLDDTGPCSGDSGSGLMIHINGRWQLRAIVSGGPKIDGECNLRSYVLYCDLAKHRTWLTSNILY